MTLQALVAELARLQITIEPRPSGKLYVTPRAAITPALADAIKQHAAELLDELAELKAAVERVFPGAKFLGIQKTRRRK